MIVLPITATTEDEYDVRSEAENRPTPTGEYLGAKLSQGFDFTTTRAAYDSVRIGHAERDAYGLSYRDDKPEYNTDKRDRWGPGGYDPLRPHRMSEEQWKASEWYREGIPFTPKMTPVRAQLMAEDFDDRRYRDSLVQRYRGGAIGQVLGFGATLLGNLPDPVNFIGLGEIKAGESLWRGARLAAGEAALGTAAADAVVLPDLHSRGEDVGWQDAATDIMFGAALGGLIGMGGQAVKNRLGDIRRARESSSPEARRVAGQVQEKALSDAAAGDPVDVRPVADANADVIARERDRLARAYDQVHSEPLGGPADEVLASIEPEDIQRLLVERGPAIEKDGQIVVQGRAMQKLTGTRRGRGLVKIIFGHGEENAATPAHLRVSRDDVTALPELVRDYDPTINDGVHREWRIPREDGNQLVFATSAWGENPESRLVTMYVDEGKGREASKKRSPASPRPSVERGGGYAAGDFDFIPTGPGKEKIVPGGGDVKAISEAVLPLQESSKNAAPVEIVQSAKDLPEHLQEWAGGLPSAPEGVYDPREGKVWLVADGIRSGVPEDALGSYLRTRAREVWQHEQGGHAGLRGLMRELHGENWHEAMSDFQESVIKGAGETPEFRAAAESSGLDISDARQARLAAEEYVARLAEKVDLGQDLTDAERGIWSRVLDMIREWLGNRPGLRDYDAEAVARAALRWTTDGHVEPPETRRVVDWRTAEADRPLEAPKAAAGTPGDVAAAGQGEISELAPEVMSEIDGMRELGELTAAEADELDAAGRASDVAQSMEEAGLSAAECLAKAVE
ncbi:hypothetical protein dsx2_2648 [Desulfovibrio sp. X2]|uniref:hypothetical protein n=1 Tax=Desulfovibrio sp. X2 TaxID=941449 RepID=UPI000358C307|nr:hypothetical protein [Desulfovibrio sp. X2]EPR42731.1 hypothetical protein dsx2_2648 [Desulfovibrio sp. X2]